MKRVLLLGSQHGDERLGDSLYAYLQRVRPELLGEVSFLLANPRAHRAKIRFVESDMNRSYVASPITYEQKRARFVQNYIKTGNFDLVLDLHTTTVKQSPCVLIRKINNKNRAFLSVFPVQNIVLMQHEIVETSLIGKIPQAISIEVNKDYTDSFLEQLCLAIKLYVHGRKTFAVTRLLNKADVSEDEVKHMTNFQLFNNEFYPVLVGENSYRKHASYLGFRADNMETIEL